MMVYFISFWLISLILIILNLSGFNIFKIIKEEAIDIISMLSEILQYIPVLNTIFMIFLTQHPYVFIAMALVNYHCFVLGALKMPSFEYNFNNIKKDPMKHIKEYFIGMILFILAQAIFNQILILFLNIIPQIY